MQDEDRPEPDETPETNQTEPDAREDDASARLDDVDLRPGQEPLTPEEKETFLARVRSEGRSLTSEEMYAIFGPPPEPKEEEPVFDDVEEMAPAHLEPNQVRQLAQNFFPELGNTLPPIPLIRGVILDWDFTLATPGRPLDELMADGAQAAEAFMRANGMELPDDFAEHILEARRFAEEKSEEEQEEHIADDAMSFLLQFVGYPASKMDPELLKRAVDTFYAPEMTAWQLRPGAKEMVQALHSAGFRIALLTNYNCDRVFQRMVDYSGLRPYLDLCISSASVEYRKPDVRFFNLVLERWDALPYEVVVVGDDLQRDIHGGMELGALTVQVALETSAQVAHDNAQAADRVTPDAVITDLAALPELVTAWAQE